MKAPRFIAGRLRFGGNMAMVSIAISFFIIIIAVAVSSGFRTEIRNGISYISGDIRITRPDMNFAGTAEPLSMNSYAIFKDSTVVAGVNSEKTIDSLKQAGVPTDIVNEYARNQTDV